MYYHVKKIWAQIGERAEMSKELQTSVSMAGQQGQNTTQFDEPILQKLTTQLCAVEEQLNLEVYFPVFWIVYRKDVVVLHQLF